MPLWDEVLDQYDLVKIKSLLGGKFTYGYPPSVGDVDIWLPEKAPFLSDKDLIAKASDGR